jgi:hypothetical protein
MNAGFLLRFQEIDEPAAMDKHTAKICMFVDQAKPNSEFAILQMATQTYTKIMAHESTDDDRHSRFLHIFPR